MKRLIVLAVILSAMATAQAQVSPRYGEVHEKETGNLRSKEWISAEGNFRIESPRDDGGVNVTIFRFDTKTAYRLDMAKKTYISFSLEQGTDAGKLTGYRSLETESSNVEREFRGKEEVEGLECDHYYVARTDALRGGSTSNANWNEWIYPVDKIWRQRDDEIRPGYYIVHRNIRIGAQPAHLFEIPNDFKGTALPMGGLLEMLGGKGRGQTSPSAAEKDLQRVLQQEKETQEGQRLMEGAIRAREQMERGGTTKTQEQLRQERLREQIRKQGSAGEE